MPQNEGNSPSLRLLERLRRLVDGNHARSSDLEAKALRRDSYPIEAWVTWQFGHEASSRSVQGNGAVPNAHFGFDMTAFQGRLHALNSDAASNRDIRVSFMQTVTVAAAGSLRHSDKPQLVKEYGASSVHRHCNDCGGRGQVACSGCQGSGNCRCAQCGGSGSHTVSVQRTRWNGQQHESYYVNEVQTCYGCYGSGRRVCAACGGSGHQRCGQCAGHGFFTDIVETRAVARPHWWVRAEGGLAHEVLENFLAERGAAEALDLVPTLSLLDTRYDDEDRWVAHYSGQADVIEQDIALRNQSWTVPAVGPKPEPMQRPPLFDHLFADEIAHARRLKGSRGQVNISARVGRQLFRSYRGHPALDQAIQKVAALGGVSGQDSVNAVRASMQGFVSRDAAADLGGAIQGLLHKVSPPYSVVAWVLVMAAPVGWVAVSTALIVPYVPDWFDGALGLAGELLGGCIGVLLFSPLAWLLSALISGLHRLRVPKPYRQKGRNWVPLRTAMRVALLAVLPGLLYGLSVKYLGLPAVDTAVEAAASWVPGHLIPRPPVGVVSTTPADQASTYRAIQHYLNGHGYPVGPEDGQPGPRTQAQIRRYLHQHHLNESLPPTAILADMLQRP